MKAEVSAEFTKITLVTESGGELNNTYLSAC